MILVPCGLALTLICAKRPYLHIYSCFIVNMCKNSFFAHIIASLRRRWKRRARVTPEAKAQLTPENILWLTPIKSWPAGSFLFWIICFSYWRLFCVCFRRTVRSDGPSVRCGQVSHQPRSGHRWHRTNLILEVEKSLLLTSCRACLRLCPAGLAVPSHPAVWGRHHPG